MQNKDYIYKFYLDGNEVSNPKGWDEMITSIKRDKDLKGVFVTMDVTFTFEGDGYDYINTVYNASDYCAEIELLIDESRDAGNNFKLFYNGIIKISDVLFERKTETAKTKVLDNSFFAKILQNKNLEAKVVSDKSKNGVTIDTPSLIPVVMYEPGTGGVVPNGGGVAGNFYKAYDLLKYMIHFMTDGEVTFDSTLFGVGGELEFTMLTFGKVIRRVQAGYTQGDFNTNIPILTFQKLFTELNGRLNLGMFIDNSQLKPIVRIEKWDDLFKNISSQSIPFIDVLKEQISTEDIYSALKIGSTVTIDSPGALQFPELIQFFGFNSETYTIIGKCNVDKTLDLTGDFVVSSNVIEQILINNTGDTSYDQDWFIVNCYDDSGTIKAKMSNWLAPSSSIVYYNEFYINSNIAIRYLKAVPNSISQYLATGDNRFRATFENGDYIVFSSSFLTFYPYIFNNDFTPPNNDPNDRYNIGTGYYTCLKTGIYDFFASQNIDFQNQEDDTDVDIRINVWLQRYNSGGNLLQTFKIADDVVITVPFGTSLNPTYSGNISTVLNEHDTMSVFVSFQILSGEDATTLYSFRESIFQCTEADTGNDIVQTYDPADYPIIKDTFDIEMDSYKFDPILSDPHALIEFSRSDHNFINGWIDEIKYDHNKQKGSFILLSSKNSR